jgi:hypothetical protein
MKYVCVAVNSAQKFACFDKYIVIQWVIYSVETQLIHTVY